MVLLFPFTGFANLLESIVLLMNAMAILNEHYFLRHCRLCSPDGWHIPRLDAGAKQGSGSFLKNQMVLAFYTMRNFGRCSRPLNRTSSYS